LHGMSLPFDIPLEPPSIIRDQSIVTIFAQLGAIILLFKVGLHSKIEHIFSRENFLVALAGVIFPFTVGYAYATYTGENFAYTMFMAATLTATSVGVTVAILKEMNVVKERFSQVIIGAAVIDDVLALLILSLVLNMTSGEGAQLESIASTFFTALIFIAGAVISGKYFIRYFDRRELGARRFTLALALMLFFSYVAEVVNLSAIVGAFIAGLILNKSRHYGSLEEKTYGLELMFMPIFFISLGMLVDVSAISEFFIPILIITFLAIITKLIGCTMASLYAKLSASEALVVGAGMVPRGEVALIIASIGLSKAVLTQQEYSIMASMALLTTFFAPPVLASLIRRIPSQHNLEIPPSA
ncbi:MAG: cation:proton antiporter, partial [Candidatus Micrarchaeota archaeon]